MPPPASTSERPVVLLAHANAEMRRFLREELARRYHVLLAAGWHEALRQARREDLDLMVVDGEMPEIGGRALYRRVKEASEVGECLVLLLRGKNRAPGSGNLEEDASEPESPADEGGDESYHSEGERPYEVLTKPFGAGVLRRHVRGLLAGEQAGIDRTVVEVLRLIDQRLGDPDLTVAELAEAAGLSRRHLTRQLKKAVDLTPGALLRGRRIEEAKRRLEKGPDTIAGVATEVGFRSPSHFSQVFRRQVGCPPSTYLERHASP